MRKIVIVVVLLCAASALAGEKNEHWLQVRSPHFLVVTNASEKQARTVADQFERMRAVFHDAFANVAVDAFAPITVLAIRNEKEFRSLEPEAYLAKGSLKIGGLFLRVPEKNYILMRLDSEGEHPYAVVYHEYTHLLTSKAAEWMPLWLNEGLAEFYENTEIEGKDVRLGQPSINNLTFLRHTKLLPIPVLFAVDHNSPYYHEENKGSIFYAESWALTHLLLMNDFQNQTHALRTYLELLARKVDPTEAATQAFGDLKNLQAALDRYVGQQRFHFLKWAKPIETAGLEYNIVPLSSSQVDAVRADFLAYNGRTGDARALLQQVLRDDVNNVSARETMGYLEARQGNISQARKWYEEAVKLDSQSYLANYNFAALAMSGLQDDGQDQAIEKSLRTAIKVNPKFAPAYDRLAVFYGMRHKNLEEAHTLSVYAVVYEPDVVAFRMNSANVLIEMNRSEDAIRVLEAALHVARNEADRAAVETALAQVKQYQEARQQSEALPSAELPASGGDRQPMLRRAIDTDEQPEPTSAATPNAPAITPEPTDDEPPALTRTRRVFEGTIESVECSAPAVLKLQLVSGARTLPLRSDNYYKVAFSAVNFTPAGELHPCSDLQGMKAKVQYVEAGGGGQIVSVELTR